MAPVAAKAVIGVKLGRQAQNAYAKKVPEIESIEHEDVTRRLSLDSNSINQTTSLAGSEQPTLHSRAHVSVMERAGQDGNSGMTLHVCSHIASSEPFIRGSHRGSLHH